MPRKFWECCCAPDSRLTAAGLATGLCGRRLTLPRCDFSMKSSVAPILTEAAACPPDWLWISIPCTAYSPFQNIRRGRSSRRSILKLQKKRCYTDLMARNCFRVAKRVVRRKKKFYYEPLVSILMWTKLGMWKRCLLLYNVTGFVFTPVGLKMMS